MAIGLPIFHGSLGCCYCDGRETMVRKAKIAIGIDVHKEKCAACATRKDGKKDKTGKLDEFNEKFRRFPSNCEGM